MPVEVCDFCDLPYFTKSFRARLDGPVVDSLMRPLVMVLSHVFLDGVSEGVFAEEEELVQRFTEYATKWQGSISQKTPKYDIISLTDKILYQMLSLTFYSIYWIYPHTVTKMKLEDCHKAWLIPWRAVSGKSASSRL